MSKFNFLSTPSMKTLNERVLWNTMCIYDFCNCRYHTFCRNIQFNLLNYCEEFFFFPLRLIVRNPLLPFSSSLQVPSNFFIKFNSQSLISPTNPSNHCHCEVKFFAFHNMVCVFFFYEYILHPRAYPTFDLEGGGDKSGTW